MAETGQGSASRPLAAKNGKAVAAMWCGIAGIFAITAVVAIVLGFQARGEIAASGGRQRGDGMAKAGILLGFVWVVFLIVAAATGGIEFSGSVGSN